MINRSVEPVTRAAWLVILVCMDQGTASIYRPRRPERTDLHLAVRENLELFLETYDKRFLDRTDR